MISSTQEKNKLDDLNHKKEIKLLKEKMELENQVSLNLRSDLENHTRKILKLENSLTEVNVLIYLYYCK
jgi:hypothetical protein